MGTEFWILSIGGSLLINVILWIIAVRIFSAVYQNKFDALVGIIRDAMTERLARAVVTDTRLFDGMIDIEDEEDIPHEREEEDTD
jgi:hypothetical protein